MANNNINSESVDFGETTHDLRVKSISLNGTGVTAAAAELNILDGALVTAAELNRAADVSTRIVVITATGAITEVLHEGKTCLLREAGGNALVTLTLPAATGGGARYRFVVDEVNTSNYVIQSVAGADVFRGVFITCDGAAVTTPLVWRAGTTDDTFTLNGTTTGGSLRGDWVEFQDVATDAWWVNGVGTASGAEATPFSDSVA